MELCAEEIQPGDLITVLMSDREDSESMMIVEEIRITLDSVTVIGTEIWADRHVHLSPVPFGYGVVVHNA